MNLCFSRTGVPISVAFLELNFGKLRFRQRQRHMIAGRDHIELTWNEHNESAGMVNATSDASGVIPGTPVEIGTRRSDDRRSRILRNHQASERRNRLCALNRQIGFDEERRPVIMQPVDGNGPARRQRHTLRPDRFTLVR
jgi:hypothetical protein